MAYCLTSNFTIVLTKDCTYTRINLHQAEILLNSCSAELSMKCIKFNLLINGLIGHFQMLTVNSYS